MRVYQKIVQNVLELLAEAQEEHYPDSQEYLAYEDMMQAIIRDCLSAATPHRP